MAAGDGLVTMTPTSIAVAGAGSSASINSDGGVDFTSATSLSLNGVFTSAYDNYLLVFRHVGSGDDFVQMRLRLAGTNATGSNYSEQWLNVYGTSRDGLRTTNVDAMNVFRCDDNQRQGVHFHMYGPGLAQPTAVRSVTVDGNGDARILDIAGTHSLSTAYDGASFFTSSGTTTFTGNVAVFGYEE